MKANLLTVGIAQIAPVWGDRDATLVTVIDHVEKAAAAGCRLVVFGETLLPGYPFWLGLTDGAQFDSALQKDLHAHYVRNAVSIEAGDLQPVCDAAAAGDCAVYLGCLERPADRGGHSVYASLVYIDAKGAIASVHRKLQPTYEERLTWSPGDGHGLRVHRLGPFTVGGLNCWENWMPLPRAALYGQGEDLHVAVWPGSIRNTEDITRFIAKEARSFVVSASSLMRRDDFPAGTPHLDAILADCPDELTDGGSCICGPDGRWVVEPVVGREELITATLDFEMVLRERQNFDPVGHYSRPDVTRLTVNRERQNTVEMED